MEKLHKLFFEETFLTKEMIEKSIHGLVTRNHTLFDEVINEKEPLVNKIEVDVDKACIKIIALYQPAARDLREIMMIFKISDNLERMADHAVNIADSGKYLISVPEVKPLIDIPKMADETITMLTDCIQAFVNRDAELARDICRRDDRIDEYRHKILEELIQIMIKNPAIVPSALHLDRITKNLERIADLITNIAEDVVYIETGELIKHSPK